MSGCCCFTQQKKSCSRKHTSHSVYCWQHQKGKCKRTRTAKNCHQKKTSTSSEVRTPRRSPSNKAVKTPVLPPKIDSVEDLEEMKQMVHEGVFLKVSSDKRKQSNVCNNDNRIKISNRSLGKGSYGEVYLGVYVIDQDTGEKVQVAIKKVQKKYALEAKKEYEILAQLSKYPKCKQYISCAYAYCAKDNHAYLTMEYIDGQDLFDFSKTVEGKRILTNVENVKNIMLELIEGLDFIHHNGFAHRDIKLENVMWDKKSQSVKYIDFGIACSESNCINMEHLQGTDYMIPPEEYMYPITHKFNIQDMKRGDVWALGYLFLELLLLAYNKTPLIFGITGRYLSEHPKQQVSNLINKKLTLKDEHIEILEIISDMMSTDPRNRLDVIDYAEELL